MTKPRAIRPVSVTESYVRFMVHGKPGVGKSVLAGTSEKGLILMNRPDEVASAAIHGSTCDSWNIDSFRELEEAHDYVLHEGYREYDWCWMDNGTLLQDQIMDEIMVDLVAAHSHRSRWTPDKPQYGETQTKMGVMVKQFCRIPIHFGITAHVERFEDEAGVVEYAPMFQGGQGKFSQKLCGYMNIVGYMSASLKEGQQQRVLHLEKRGKFYAKDRYDSTPNGKMIDPTIPKLMEGISKKLPKPEPRRSTGAAKKSPSAIKKTTATRRTTTRRNG